MLQYIYKNCPELMRVSGDPGMHLYCNCHFSKEMKHDVLQIALYQWCSIGTPEGQFVQIR